MSLVVIAFIIAFAPGIAGLLLLYINPSRPQWLAWVDVKLESPLCTERTPIPKTLPAYGQIPPGVWVTSWEEERMWLKRDWALLRRDPFNSPAED